MNRTDSSTFLLFIEPMREEKSSVAIKDKLTEMMTMALERAERGTSNYSQKSEPPSFEKGNAWRGFHITLCGKISGNQEYLLENGMITNSLAIFYLEYYRNSIPNSEMKKIFELARFYGLNQY